MSLTLIPLGSDSALSSFLSSSSSHSSLIIAAPTILARALTVVRILSLMLKVKGEGHTQEKVIFFMSNLFINPIYPTGKLI